MNPRTILEDGAAVLHNVLAPHGFHFEFREEALGSGGHFAWGEFVRDDRRLELHFRFSLGLVSYHIGELALEHTSYMAALGVKGRARYPRVANDPLGAFHDLAHDLGELAASDFLAGPASVLRAAAEAAAADAPRRQ